MVSQSFGKAIGVACASFAITNIDDMFVLITFFSEATTSKTLTPFRIVLGQFIGFTIIVAVSLIGFGFTFLFPTEPIGFMGFVPLLLGVWRGLPLIPIFREEEDREEESMMAGIKNVLKVVTITFMNGGDNIGTYVPLFSQARKGDIAIYVVTYYILLAIWCGVAFAVMRQKHILALAKRYLRFVLPFLYIGLGLYIIIKSSCYPWSVDEIDQKVSTHPGKIILGVVTSFVVVGVICGMVGLKLISRKKRLANRVVADDSQIGSRVTMVQTEQ